MASSPAQRSSRSLTMVAVLAPSGRSSRSRARSRLAWLNWDSAWATRALISPALMVARVSPRFTRWPSVKGIVIDRSHDFGGQLGPLHGMDRAGDLGQDGHGLQVDDGDLRLERRKGWTGTGIGRLASAPGEEREGKHGGKREKRFHGRKLRVGAKGRIQGPGADRRPPCVRRRRRQRGGDGPQ